MVPSERESKDGKKNSSKYIVDTDTQREDDVKTQGEDRHLQAKE